MKFIILGEFLSLKYSHNFQVKGNIRATPKYLKFLK